MKYKQIIFLTVIILFMCVVSAEELPPQEICIPQYQCQAWSECDGGLTTRTCIDVACGKKDVLERSFCDNPGCTPDVQCDEWRECTYTQKTSDLINGEVNFEGYRYRTCRDKNKCIPAFQQEAPCKEQNKLLFSPIEECNQRMLAVIDPVSERKIAKINLDSWLQNKFDLSFTQGETKYCPGCYNAVQDGQETDIDCGGPQCKSCKKEHTYLSIFAIIFLWSGSIIFSFLSVREVIITRKKETMQGQI